MWTGRSQEGRNPKWKGSQEQDQGISSIMDRSEFLTNPAVWKITSLRSGRRYMDDDIIFPGQRQSKGKKEKKGFSV